VGYRDSEINYLFIFEISVAVGWMWHAFFLHLCCLYLISNFGYKF